MTTDSPSDDRTSTDATPPGTTHDAAGDSPTQQNRANAHAPAARAATNYQHRRILTRSRIILALVLTVLVLPYAWGRTLVFTMLMGTPEWMYMGLLCAAGFAVIASTFHLSRRFERAPLRWFAALAAFAGWNATNALILTLYAGGTVPQSVTIAIYLPASLWIVWMAWMFYFPLRWRTRVAVLLPLLVVFVGFISLVRVDGLMGDTRFQFAWRWESRLDEPIALEPLPAPSQAADLSVLDGHAFPQFLGPDRNAVVRGVRLARDWNARPPQLIWRKDVGTAWSSFAISGDLAFTQEQRGHEECVVCYRLTDGTEVWAHADPVHFDTSMGGPGPRATPTIHEGLVYAVGATGLLNCLDASTGARQWSVDILSNNDGEPIAHGLCASPLIVGETVVVCPTGRDDRSLAAYDRLNGERLWQAGRHPASYSSPQLAELFGVPQILLFTAESLDAHEPATGEFLWSFPWNNTTRVNVAQPIPNAGQPGRIFISTGYGKGSVLLQLENSPSSGWLTKELWTSRRMKTKFTSAVLFDGHVFGLDDGILQCVELASGKQRWKRGRYGHGQVLLVGDLLLIQSENGDIVLVEPSERTLVELGRYSVLTGKTWNNPALAGSRLLVRNDHEAACLELPLQDEQPPRKMEE